MMGDIENSRECENSYENEILRSQLRPQSEGSFLR